MPGRLLVLRGLGNGSFSTGTPYSVGGHPRAIAVTDVDTDGRLDLAAANTADNTVSVLLGDGNGTFFNRIDYGAEPQLVALAAGDLTGDARTDLIVSGNSRYQVAILRNALPSLAHVPIPAATAPRGPVQRVHPNPTRGTVTVSWVLPEATRVDAEVFDLNGRSVGVLARAVDFSQGEHEFKWDCRSAEGTLLPAGLYFVHVRTRHEARTTRVVVVR